MAISALLSIGAPVALLVWVRRRHRGGFVPVIAGAAVFCLFVFVLEIRFAVWVAGTPAGAWLQGNRAVYSLYGGLLAGVFEETGRLFALLLLCRRYRGVQHGIAYGIGHGGVEAVLLTGLSMASSVAFALHARFAGMDRAMQAFGVSGDALARLLETPPAALLVTGIERLFAIALHIALSVLVYLAVTRRGRFRLFWLAIALHALADFPAGLYQTGLLTNIWAAELLVAALCAGVCVLTRLVWTESNRGYTDLLPYDPL